MKVELDSSEVPDCAYVAVVEAATEYHVGSGHLTVALVRVYIAPMTGVFTTCTRTRAKHRPTAMSP